MRTGDVNEESSRRDRRYCLSVNPSRKFTLLSNCAYYPGTKPRKKHALNNQYAPNTCNELHLLTHEYGISVRTLVRRPPGLPDLLRPPVVRYTDSTGVVVSTDDGCCSWPFYC